AEVELNEDLSVVIAPRIEAQVLKRFVQVGDYVKEGQPLVTLTSVSMMDAQSNFILAVQEWERVKELGKKAVSAKRYQGAEIAFKQAYGKLRAYGMLDEQIKALLTEGDIPQAIGEFTLLAPRKGRIFKSDFTEGAMIDAGVLLFQIVDESTLWVDARLSNEQAAGVKPGYGVIVFSHDTELAGKVLQRHHQLDEVTRTQIIRIEVPNPQDLLHPGEFVNVKINIGETSLLLALPEEAVLPINDGEWVVYSEVKPDLFKQFKVTIKEVVNEMMAVEGVESGMNFVVEGAFFVHSELIKSGFEPHDH
ncbi:MAG: efflux RND transporter periplasmic adaptor subunit, partial [Gammaproteobacteria bacterium]